MSEEPLVPVVIPALVAILLNQERSAGRPLTESEVLSIRDQGVCMMMRLSEAQNMADSRGYDDVDPANVWAEWQRVRLDLTEE